MDCMPCEIKKLLFLSCTNVEEEIFFVSSDVNLLCAFNVENKKIRFIDHCPDEIFSQSSLYGNIIYDNNKLILAPLMAKNIWVYDFSNSHWGSIDLPENIANISFKFFGMVQFGNNIFFLGHYYKGILCVDIDDKSVQEIPINIIDDGKEGALFLWDYVIRDKWCYLPSLKSNQVVVLNLETKEVEYRSIGDKKNKYVGLTWDGSYFWLAPRLNGKYVRWDGDTDVTEYSLPEEFNNEDFYFIGAYMDGYNVVFPGMVNRLGTLVFDKNTPNDTRIIKEEVSFYKSFNNTLIKQNMDGKLVIKDINKEILIDTMMNKEEWDSFEEDMVVASYKKRVGENLFLYENSTDKLRYYLKCIT